MVLSSALCPTIDGRWRSINACLRVGGDRTDLSERPDGQFVGVRGATCDPSIQAGVEQQLDAVNGLYPASYTALPRR